MAQSLQAGAQLSLIDAFDRGISRDAFIDILKDAMMLHTFTSRLSMVAHIKDEFERTGHGMNAEDFKTAMHAVTGECERHRTSLIKNVSLLVQCPLEDDTRH